MKALNITFDPSENRDQRKNKVADECRKLPDGYNVISITLHKEGYDDTPYCGDDDLDVADSVTIEYEEL